MRAILIAMLVVVAARARAEGAYCFDPNPGGTRVDWMRQHCREGDTIELGSNDGAKTVALLCDMTKSVTVVGGHIVCALSTPKVLR